MRALAPDQWQVIYRAEKLCERAAQRQGRKITTEEVARVLAGFRQVCAVLGPGAQEALQARLEPLVEQIGLASEVNRAAEGLQGAIR